MYVAIFASIANGVQSVHGPFESTEQANRWVNFVKKEDGVTSDCVVMLMRKPMPIRKVKENSCPA